MCVHARVFVCACTYNCTRVNSARIHVTLSSPTHSHDHTLLPHVHTSEGVLRSGAIHKDRQSRIASVVSQRQVVAQEDSIVLS